jgi:hypothetical protein
MPWRKFKTSYRHQVRPGSDSVIQIYQPGQIALITTACELVAAAAGALDDELPEVSDEMHKANTEAVIGQDDKPKSAVRKARQAAAGNTAGG